jgi:Bax protein
VDRQALHDLLEIRAALRDCGPSRAVASGPTLGADSSLDVPGLPSATIEPMPEVPALRLAFRRVGLRTVALLAGIFLATVVTALGLSALLPAPVPDLRELEAGPARKAAFFSFVRPLVEAENARVLTVRRHLEALADETDLGWLDRWWLARVARQYRLDPGELEANELIAELLVRVDAVPVSLALAQSAKESGWGTSRFARKGYNLFGEWCYTAGCGFVPRRRAEGRRHQVERFASPEQSVASYVRNINTHESYQAFREERARLRAAGRPLSGLHLANSLGRYSERRQDYVREVKRMILVNDLEDPATNAGG